MTTASANPDAGSDHVPQSISLDDAANLDFRDPEEDNGEWRPDAADNQGSITTLKEAAEQLKPDREGEESDGSNPAETNDADGADEHDRQPILLKGGEQVTLGELKLGYLRDKDYRHKTMALGNSRRSLESTAARVVRTVDTIAGYLANQLPEEPSRALAIQNPAEYTRRKAMFDSGLDQIQAILAYANDTKSVKGELTREQMDEKLAVENSRLTQAFPELQRPDLREKFFADAFRAGEGLGFTPEEMREFNDHRYFKVMHWALKGLEAERARGQAMKKMDNAPPMTPRARQAGRTAGNRDAMKRLIESGSIKDSLQVDF